MSQSAHDLRMFGIYMAGIGVFQVAYGAWLSRRTKAVLREMGGMALRIGVGLALGGAVFYAQPFSYETSPFAFEISQTIGEAIMWAGLVIAYPNFKRMRIAGKEKPQK